MLNKVRVWVLPSSSGSSGSNGTYYLGQEGSSAYSMAHDWVKRRLKNPHAAEFPGTWEKKNHITSLGNHTYQIKSWVEEQNGFGAKIRTPWIAVVERIDKSEWKLHSLGIQRNGP